MFAEGKKCGNGIDEIRGQVNYGVLKNNGFTICRMGMNAGGHMWMNAIFILYYTYYT